jgi:hypothetical protein
MNWRRFSRLQARGNDPAAPFRLACASSNSAALSRIAKREELAAFPHQPG